MPQMRLDKLLSHLNCGSRKEVQALIRAGRVSVDGAVQKDPAAKVDPDRAQTAVDGVVQRYRAQRYYMLNKPAGVITASRDERHDTVLELFPEKERRGLFAVGRLDKDTEGLLLLTNDGALTQRLLHPSREIEKEYRVTVTGPVEGAVGRLAAIRDLEGERIRPARVRELWRDGNKAALSVTIHEGKNRQIRRMCRQAGLAVRRLQRVREHTLTLGDLPVGRWRYLTQQELQMLEGSEKR